MDLTLFLKGLLIGVSIAAPVGPIGVLCIRRTLAGGRALGFASGLGAATADALYGCVAGFGLTFISSFLVGQQAWLRLVGGVFLCVLGVRTLLSRPAEAPARVEGKGLAGAYFSTFVLTLTNPMTILSFAAIFSGLGLAGGGYDQAGWMVAGVFLGSSAWWLVLSAGVGIFAQRLEARTLVWVNRVSGVVVTGFGLWALAGLLGGAG